MLMHGDSTYERTRRASQRFSGTIEEQERWELRRCERWHWTWVGRTLDAVWSRGTACWRTRRSKQRARRALRIYCRPLGALRALLREAGLTAKERCGHVDWFSGDRRSRDGTIHSTLKKYVDAPKLDLVLWARETFDLRLRIENDARMALLGEQYAGAGRGIEDIVMMTLGTGIGSAAFLNGRLLRGEHAHAGCLADI